MTITILKDTTVLYIINVTATIHHTAYALIHTIVHFSWPQASAISEKEKKLEITNTHLPTIIESVDSICRDGADTPISLNKSNGSELPNADV